MNELSWLFDTLTTWTGAGAVAIWWLSLWLRNVAARQAQEMPATPTRRHLLLWGLALASLTPPIALGMGVEANVLLWVGRATVAVGLAVSLLKLPFLLYRAGLIGFSLLELYLLGPSENPHQQFGWLALILAAGVMGGGLHVGWGGVQIFGLTTLAGALNVGMAHLVFQAVETGGPFTREEIS